MIPAFFFLSLSSQGFSERISCDPNPDSWSLNRRNEIISISHLLIYKIMIYSFLTFPFLSGSGSKRLLLCQTSKIIKACESDQSTIIRPHYLSIYLSIYLYFCLFIYLSTYLVLHSDNDSLIPWSRFCNKLWTLVGPWVGGSIPGTHFLL